MRGKKADDFWAVRGKKAADTNDFWAVRGKRDAETTDTAAAGAANTAAAKAEVKEVVNTPDFLELFS